MKKLMTRKPAATSTKVESTTTESPNTNPSTSTAAGLSSCSQMFLILKSR